MLETTREEDAYLAGIIDGDGWITCGHSTGIRKNGKSWDNWFVGIGLKNNSYAVMQWVQQHYGGKIYRRPLTEKSIGFRKKIGYEWHTHKKDNILKIIQKIQPYLIIKKARFELIKEFYSQFLNLQKADLPFADKEIEIDRRQKIKEKLGVLNAS